MNLPILKSLLKEVQERVTHPLPYLRPFEAELTNPLPREARSKQFGTARKVTFDIDLEFYTMLQHRLPEGVTLKGILWVEDASAQPPEEAAEVKEREAKPKPERGIHGKFWELLHSFHNRPDVRGWLGFDVGYASEKAALAALYRIFNKTSRTFISPDDLRAWVARMPDCDGALKVIETAKAKVAG